MKLLFAQGNPGAQYTNTRHNIGWQILDMYAEKNQCSFVQKLKFSAFITEYLIKGEKVLLVKPTTFYNDTGNAIRALINFYKIDTKDTLVLHDDLALPLGTIRVRDKGRDAGNNGIKSINAAIGEDYMRLRIGISTELKSRMNDSDFVLSKFTKQEQEFLDSDIVPQAMSMIDRFINGSLDTSSITLQNPSIDINTT